MKLSTWSEAVFGVRVTVVAGAAGIAAEPEGDQVLSMTCVDAIEKYVGARAFDG